MNFASKSTSRPLPTLQLLALAIVAATTSEATAADEQVVKFQYEVGYSLLQQATAKINTEAEKGWRLKSASPAQCPTNSGYPPGASCVFVVMEREQK